MKDAVGITRQTISVQRITPQKALALNPGGVTVVAASLHTNKLKLGHLKGNRFRIIVRDVSPVAQSRTPEILDVIGRCGVPNYFGFQRYGAQGNSHLVGHAMLRKEWRECVDRLIGEPDAVRDEEWSNAICAYQRGDFSEALRLFPRHCRSERDVLQRLIARPGAYEKAFAAVHPRLWKLYLSAAQAFVFDQVVARRIDHLHEIITGDLAFKHANGACFIVEDAAVEQWRAAAFEISASGPMFGSKMKRPEGEVLKLEHDILEHEGLTLSLFDKRDGIRMEGERRPLRVPAGDLSWGLSGNSLTMEFTLPKGSYATSLIREVTKTF
jgi:tRNA pseudouridine13 synthase